MRESLAPLATAGNVFVSGSVQGRLQDNGITLQRRGDATTLYYARPDSIVGTGPMREVALTVQVRHKAGVQVP